MDFLVNNKYAYISLSHWWFHWSRLWSCGSQNQLVAPRSPPLSPHWSSSQFFLQTESVTWKKIYCKTFLIFIVGAVLLYQNLKAELWIWSEIDKIQFDQYERKIYSHFQKKKLQTCKNNCHTHFFSLNVYW